MFCTADEKYGSFMEYCLYITATMILDSTEQLGFLWRKGKCYTTATITKHRLSRSQDKYADSRTRLYNKDDLHQIKCRVQQNIDYK